MRSRIKEKLRRTGRRRLLELLELQKGGPLSDAQAAALADKAKHQTRRTARRRRRTGSAHDLARDLTGGVSGPQDLSISKRHFKTFGR